MNQFSTTVFPPDPDNELRLTAAEIIRRLWNSKNVTQLCILQSQIKSSLSDLTAPAAAIALERDGRPHEDDWELAEAALILAKERQWR